MGKDTLLHGKLMPPDCYRVSVEVARKEVAFLPFPNGDIILVNHVVGTFVAWDKGSFFFIPSGGEAPNKQQKINGKKIKNISTTEVDE